MSDLVLAIIVGLAGLAATTFATFMLIRLFEASKRVRRERIAAGQIRQFVSRSIAMQKQDHERRIVGKRYAGQPVLVGIKHPALPIVGTKHLVPKPVETKREDDGPGLGTGLVLGAAIGYLAAGERVTIDVPNDPTPDSTPPETGGDFGGGGASESWDSGSSDSGGGGGSSE